MIVNLNVFFYQLCQVFGLVSGLDVVNGFFGEIN